VPCRGTDGAGVTERTAPRVTTRDAGKETLRVEAPRAKGTNARRCRPATTARESRG